MHDAAKVIWCPVNIEEEWLFYITLSEPNIARIDCNKKVSVISNLLIEKSQYVSQFVGYQSNVGNARHCESHSCIVNVPCAGPAS